MIGFAGNGRYDETGGGTNYQCMPNQAVYNKYYGNSGGVGTVYNGYIAGVEYQTYSYGIFPNEAYDDNVPCAVCYANNRPSVMMIPAQRDCASDWHKEYEGRVFFRNSQVNIILSLVCFSLISD